MPLQVAEQWLSMIAHQVKVTLHNHGILMKQHKPMHSHLRTMRRATRQQAKDRTLPLTPKKAHSRAVQAAVKECASGCMHHGIPRAIVGPIRNLVGVVNGNRTGPSPSPFGPLFAPTRLNLPFTFFQSFRRRAEGVIFLTSIVA